MAKPYKEIRHLMEENMVRLSITLGHLADIIDKRNVENKLPPVLLSNMLFLYQLLIFFITINHVYSENKTLHIIHLSVSGYPFGMHFGSTVDYVAELVNQRDDILTGYHVQIHTFEASSVRGVGTAVKAFIESVSRDPIKTAILGPFGSGQTKVVAETAKYYNLAQLTYLATSPELSDKVKYPYLARCMESTALNNLAIVKVIEHFGWKRIGLISNDVEYTTGAKNNFVEILHERNISVAVSGSYNADPSAQIRNINDIKARIVVSFSEIASTQRKSVICAVYKNGLYGRRFQWLQWHEYYGLMDELERDYLHDGCTKEQVLKAAEGTILFRRKDNTADDYRTVIGANGMTAQQFEESYHEFLQQNADKYDIGKITVFSNNSVDAAWTLLSALNDSLDELEEIGVSLEEFSYEREDFANILFENIKKQQFIGQNGLISYDKNGDILVDINIYQLRNGKIVLVGEYNPFTDILQWFVDNNYLFYGEKVPMDEDLVIVKHRKIHAAMYSIFTCWAVLGIIYSAIGVIFSWRHRHTRFIRMSSPRMNYLIALGCILTYLAVILWGSEGSENQSVQESICVTRLWLLVFGFTLSFGSMFSKTFRVHHVVTAKTVKKKIIKDAQLYMMVFGLLGIDLFILVLWQIIDPIVWQKLYLDIEEDEDKDGIIFQPIVYVCSSKYGSYWSSALYVIKGILIIFGIFFAWETRKIQIEGLNDSKHIGISVYNVMIASVLTVPLVSILSDEQHTTVYAITVISMLACTTLTITLVFGTKMYTMLQHGKRVDDLVKTPFQASLKAPAEASASAPCNTQMSNFTAQ